MNRQLKYPLIFLVALLLGVTALRPPIVKTLISTPMPTLPAMTILLSPSGSIGTDYSPTYTWHEAAGVTWYHLHVRSINSDGATQTIYDQWHQTSTVCNNTICSVTPDLTLTPGNYKWSIQIWNDVEYGTWSSAMDFSTSPKGTTYYVSPTGDDSNPGTQTSPWQSIQKAVKSAAAGDTVLVREGEYPTPQGGWSFQISGTEAQPITLSNYPGEQVVIKIAQVAGNYTPFSCLSSSTDPASWQTTKADFIHILGTDVSPRTLSNGVVSQKGIVIQGIEGEQVYGFSVTGCDYWEVAGIDFIETAAGIRTWKHNYRTMDDNSADYWYVHDNRVYNYYRESGMQFNGDNNIIENNEIYKVSNRLDTPYGCQLLNILGDNNVIRGNTLSRLGSTAKCAGILFEWDLADANMVEQNLIFDVTAGIDIQGGDNNIIRNNIIYVPNTPEPHSGGIEIFSYDSFKTDWPCNEESGSAQSLLPANNPAHPDYQYYYNPRNCNSFGNKIYNNVIHGFVESVHLYPLAGENTIIRNNVFSGWTRGSICYYISISWSCYPLPVNVTADHNADHGPFGFVDINNFDFHLTPASPLIDTGLNLEAQNLTDFDGNPRPQGTDYDIGAYEYLFDTQP